MIPEHKNCIMINTDLSVNGHIHTSVVNHQQERARWNTWPFPLRFNHPSKKASQERTCRGGGRGWKRKMNHTMSSLCHLAHCERHKSEQWCTWASAGDLCMLIFIDLAHLFMRQGHCLSTHYSAKLAVIPSYAIRPGNWWKMPPSPPIHLSEHLLTLATFED